MSEKDTWLFTSVGSWGSDLDLGAGAGCCSGGRGGSSRKLILVS